LSLFNSKKDDDQAKVAENPTDAVRAYCVRCA
jgi:hypothetical protein